MSTELIGIKKVESKLIFTKPIQIPNRLNLLTDPLINIQMKMIASCNDGDLNKLLLSIFTSTSTPITPAVSTAVASSASTSISTKDKNSMKRYNKHVKKFDIGYVIPLNVEKHIEALENRIKKYKNINDYPINNYFKINNANNNFIYQLINNELYVLSVIIKNYFDNNKDSFFKNNRKELFEKITNNLNYMVNHNNFKNIIMNLFTNKNSRHTNTIYGGCMTMQGHNKYSLPTTEEKHYHAAIIIRKYMQEYSIDFKKIKNKIIFNYFEKTKEFDESVDLGKIHFQHVLKSKNRYDFYLFLADELFPNIISLESIIKNIIRINFPELYNNFNIDLPGVKTNLSFFKSFAINISIPGNNDKLNEQKQGATDPHKDNNDCKNAFCMIVVFGEFEGGDLVLSEIGIVIEIKCGYIVLIRSALLEHFNLHVLNNRFSVVYYLKKTFYNEI